MLYWDDLLSQRGFKGVCRECRCRCAAKVARVAAKTARVAAWMAIRMATNLTRRMRFPEREGVVRRGDVVAIGSWVVTRASPVKEGERKFLSQCTIGAGVTQGEGVIARLAHAAISSAAALDGRGGSGVEYVRRAGAIHRSVHVGRIRLAAQDAALSRRRSRVRIPYALPFYASTSPVGAFVLPRIRDRFRLCGMRPGILFAASQHSLLRF